MSYRIEMEFPRPIGNGSANKWAFKSTVDLISYTVTALGPTPTVDEASSGSGRLCGSAFLDRIFDHWLRNKFEGYMRWDEEYHAEAMRKWESDLKRNFEGDMTKDYTLPAQGLPNNDKLGIRNRKVIISGERIRIHFEPVIQEILDLIDDQLSRVRLKHGEIKAILLAGGLGSNKYLKTRIERRIGSAIRVIKIENRYYSCSASDAFQGADIMT